jgi:hypothetical protein
LDALGNRVLEAGAVDGGVDGGGADVGVAGDLADHCGAGVGAVRAERVAQHARRAPILGEVGGGGVARQRRPVDRLPRAAALQDGRARDRNGVAAEL